MRNQAQKIQDIMIHEDRYEEEMLHIVEPYLAGRERKFYLKSGVPQHPAKRGLNRLLRSLRVKPEEEQLLFCACYRADQPRGILLISHGFCETAEKYKEVIYYFLRMGYHVLLPEHCGHGRSYRLTTDPSLVHVDQYERYVADLLRIARAIRQSCPELPLYLYGHSMGGGIAAAAAAADGVFFRSGKKGCDAPCIRKLILTSPMIRPSTGKLPWRTARAIARAYCRTGRGESYVPGHHPYRGLESFEDSSSASRPRFDYYQQKKAREPKFQTSAASCQWVDSSFRLYRHLIQTGWRQISCPVALFQADREDLVSKKAQRNFIRRLNYRAKRLSARPNILPAHPNTPSVRPNTLPARLIPIPGSKHEIFNSSDPVLAVYWQQVFDFLSE